MGSESFGNKAAGKVEHFETLEIIPVRALLADAKKQFEPSFILKEMEGLSDEILIILDRELSRVGETFNAIAILEEEGGATLLKAQIEELRSADSDTERERLCSDLVKAVRT